MQSRGFVRLVSSFLGSCLCVSAGVEAGQVDVRTARQDRRLQAVRAAGPIAIDGLLSEPDWVRAPLATGFVQNDPREGEAASEETEVRVLYDASNLYIGVFAHDGEPERIITSELTDDFNRLSGDDFEVVLDAFHDERNGYMFGGQLPR